MGWLKRNQAEEPVSVGAELVVMPPALRIAAANLKGRVAVPDNQVVKVSMAEVFPFSAAIIQEQRVKEAALKKAQEEFDKNPLQIGKFVPNRGIYQGIWEPKDKSGKSLGKKFHLFSDDRDIKDSSGKNLLLTFKDAAKHLAGVKNRHGHDGAALGDNWEHYEAALYGMLKDGGAIGKWFIPPREIVHGKDTDGNVVFPDNNHYALRNTGDFKGTFVTTRSSDDDSDWYWSCTEDRVDTDGVYNVDFTDGADGWSSRDGCRLSCRPCRVELVI